MRDIINKWGIELLGVIGAFFMPISGVLLMVSAMVLLDFITGIMKVKKRKQRTTSAGYKRTVLKWASYMLVVMIAHGIETAIELPVDVSALVLTGLCYVELKSIDENWEEVYGYSIFKKVINLIKPTKDGDKTSNG